jgi:hypothetical protein
MSNPADLCSLAQAQAWAGNLASNTTLVAQLITAVSRQILSTLSRPSILPAPFTEVLDWLPSRRFMLRNYPVLSVSSVVVDNTLIPALASPAEVGVTPTSPGYGYFLAPWDGLPPGRPQTVEIDGYRALRSRNNVVIAYSAGYQASDTQTIAAGALSAAQVCGAWTTDCGVTYAATGAALTRVASSPLQGQYAVAAGQYTFNAADDGQEVTLAYGYVPYDLANAAAQWVSELLAYEQHIGQRSKSVGGQETVSYVDTPMPTRVRAMILPYRLTAPI